MTEEMNGLDREVRLEAAADRLAAAALKLEEALQRVSGRETVVSLDAEACIERVVATIEARRETDLEQRLAAAEAELLELRAKAAATPQERGRKTMPANVASLLAKQGVTVESLEAGALDAALSSLSMEQRIAVKAQLMRAGVLS